MTVQQCMRIASRQPSSSSLVLHLSAFLSFLAFSFLLDRTAACAVASTDLGCLKGAYCVRPTGDSESSSGCSCKVNSDCGVASYCQASFKICAEYHCRFDNYNEFPGYTCGPVSFRWPGAGAGVESSVFGSSVVADDNGFVFGFTGRPDSSYRFVADRNFQINALFRGRRWGDRYVTWITLLSIMFGDNQVLTVFALPNKRWVPELDHLVFILNVSVISGTPETNQTVVRDEKSGVTIRKLEEKDLAQLTIDGVMDVVLKASPAVDTKYRDNTTCFVHLGMAFAALNVSDQFRGFLRYRWDHPNNQNGKPEVADERQIREMEVTSLLERM